MSGAAKHVVIVHHHRDHIRHTYLIAVLRSMSSSGSDGLTHKTCTYLVGVCRKYVITGTYT